MENKKIIWGVSALAVVMAGAGIYMNFFRPSAPVPAEVSPESAQAPAPLAPAPAAPAVPPAAARPSAAPIPGVPPAAEPPPLPKLEESDAFVRRKAAALSSNRRFAGWLKTDDLVPRVATALNLIANGKVPVDSLAVLAPSEKFTIKADGDSLFLDPQSYSRYDSAANMVKSMNAAAAAKVFQELKPLLQEAWKGLGEKNGDVQDGFVRAAQELLQTPVVKGEVSLKESDKGIVYAFTDESLEHLSPVQKQLLRMGPKNEAKVQAKLREIVAALGAR